VGRIARLLRDRDNRPSAAFVVRLVGDRLAHDQLQVVHSDLHVVGMQEAVGPFMIRDSGSVKLYCIFESDSTGWPLAPASSFFRASSARLLLEFVSADSHVVAAPPEARRRVARGRTRRLPPPPPGRAAASPPRATAAVCRASARNSWLCISTRSLAPCCYRAPRTPPAAPNSRVSRRTWLEEPPQGRCVLRKSAIVRKSG